MAKRRDAAQLAAVSATPTPAPTAETTTTPTWRFSVPPHVRMVSRALLPLYSNPALSGPGQDGPQRPHVTGDCSHDATVANRPLSSTLYM